MSKNKDGASSSFERVVYVILLIASTVCLLIGVILNLAHGDAAKTNFPAYALHIFEVFITELGIAGFVALLIIVTIEKFTREKHSTAAERQIDQIKTNLFHAIYERHIPDEVFAEVERCLLAANVIRRNYSISYDLNYIHKDMATRYRLTDEDVRCHLLCDISVTYEIENICDSEIIAPIDMNLELPIDENMSKLVGIDSLHIHGDQLSVDGLFKNSKSHCEFHHQVNLPPRSKAKIRLQGHTVKRKTDMEVWASRIPSDGLTLEVSAPESISVQAKANHSSNLSYSLHNSGKRHRWELEKGIFPFQSVIFWWKAE